MTPAEPNYAYGGGTPTNVNSPQQAAALWPYIVGNFSKLGIALLAPSAINCAYPSDANCRYVGTITGWLNAFKAVSNSYHGTSERTGLSLSHVLLGRNVCCSFILHLGTLSYATPHCFVCGIVLGIVHSCKQALASYYVTCSK